MITHKTLKDSSWNILDYISTLVIFLITTKILLAEIGTDGYGFYTFFTSLIGTFGLVDLGMGMAVSKYLSEFLHHKKYNEANQVITIAFLFYGIIGFCLFIIIYFFNTNIITFLNFNKKFSNIGSNILLITSIIFIINMIGTIMINTLVALEKWKNISSINIILKIFNAITLIFILTRSTPLKYKIIYIFYLLLVVALFKAIIYFINAKKHFKQLAFAKPTEELRKKVLKFIKTSSMQYLLSFISMHLDNFIVTKFFGLESMGLYVFVRNAFFYLYGFIANIFKIYLPKLSKLHGDKNYKELKIHFKNLLIFSIILSTIISLACMFIWKPFITLYIDKKFAIESFNYVQIFVLFLIVRSIEPIFSYFFNAIANPFILVINLLITSISTIVGYLIFVPYFNIYGLIISQIIAALLVYTYNFYKIKRKGFDDFF